MKNILKVIGYFAVYFVIQFMMQVGFMMVAAGALGMNTENGLLSYTTERLLLITILSNLLVVGLFCLYFKLRKRKIAAQVGAVKVSAGNYILPLGIAFSFSFAWTLITYNVNFSNSIMIVQSEAFYSDKIPYLGTVMKVLALLISAPVAEEFICRGIMITKLKQSYSDTVAVVISAVIFGLMHLMAGGALLAVGAAMMGAVFGIIYVKTKSLWPAVAAHVAANLPDFVLELFGELNDWVRWGMTVVFVIVFAVCMVRFLKENESQGKVLRK